MSFSDAIVGISINCLFPAVDQLGDCNGNCNPISFEKGQKLIYQNFVHTNILKTALTKITIEATSHFNNWIYQCLQKPYLHNYIYLQGQNFPNSCIVFMSIFVLLISFL